MRVAALSMTLLALTGQLQSRVADAAAVKTILHFSDVHLNVSSDGQRIPFRYFSDATVELLESALTHAQQVLPEPTFFLYSGDHAVHGRYSDAQLALAVETNVAVMEKYFPPKSDAMLEATAIIGNADGSTCCVLALLDQQTDLLLSYRSGLLHGGNESGQAHQSVHHQDLKRLEHVAVCL